MQLTSTQLESVRNGQPLRFRVPDPPGEFVVIPAEWFDRWHALLRPEDADPEKMYPLLAEVSPGDWEDAATYGLTPTAS